MKAILEFEAPESCYDCPLSRYAFKMGEIRCNILNIFVEQQIEKRDCQCPLKFIDDEIKCQVCGAVIQDGYLAGRCSSCGRFLCDECADWRVDYHCYICIDCHKENGIDMEEFRMRCELEREGYLNESNT